VPPRGAFRHEALGLAICGAEIALAEARVEASGARRAELFAVPGWAERRGEAR
jgi:hypothetical protein